MQHDLRLVLVGIAASGAFACARQPPPDLHVLAFSPAVRRDVAQPLQLQFSAPAVGAEAVGKPVAEVPLTLRSGPEGEVEGLSARWTDRQTLLVTASGLHAATRYTVTLRGPLAARTAETTFAFVEAPLQVLGVSGFDREAAPPGGFDFQIAFNQPVRSEVAAARCVLKAFDEETVIKEVQHCQVSPQLAVHMPPLPAGSRYHLHCADVRPESGDVPLLEPFDVTLTVAPPFSVRSLLPAPGAAVDPDAAHLRLAFSTPVSSERVAEAVRLTPPVPKLSQYWRMGGDDSHEAVLELEPQTAYTLTVDKDLQDTYGQTLAADVSPTFAFRTASGKARMRLDRGVVTLEPNRPGPRLWTRNVDRVHLRCAPIPPQQAARVLAKTLPMLDPDRQETAELELDWRGLQPAELDLDLDGQTDKWHAESLDLPRLCRSPQRGLILAEVTSPQMRAAGARVWGEPARQRLVVNVTDIGLVAKTGPESGVLWAVGLGDGMPIAGAQAVAYTPSGRITARGTTDADGLWLLPGNAVLVGPADPSEAVLAAADRTHRSARETLFVARRGDDVGVVLGSWQSGLYPWSFGVPFSWDDVAPTQRGALFSDRGVYRPGEVAHFKGLVRALVAGAMTVPRARVVRVQVVDPREAVVLETTTALTPFGGFALDLPLPAEAALGDWQVVATAGDLTLRQSFLVAEFRRQNFEVKVTPPQPAPASREPLRFRVAARYLFGAPVAAAAVRWRLARRSRELAFPQYDGWHFAAADGDGREDDGYSHLAPATEGTATTDADGALSFDVPLAVEDGNAPLDYVAHVEVVDSANDAVAGEAVATVFPASVYLGLTAPWLAEAKKPMMWQAVALHPDGTPAEAEAALELQRDEWQCQPHVGWADDDCRRTEEVVLRQTVRLTGAATASTLVPPAPGSYRLTLRALDPQGHAVRAALWLWVHGPGETHWAREDAVRMDMVAASAAFQPGQTAQVLARTALAGGTSLLTLERAGVLSARVQRHTAAAQPLDFPLSAEHAPNVMAGVVSVLGRQGPGEPQRPRLQMGLVNLPVAVADRRLEVAVATSREAYAPGEEVTVTVTLASAGVPVEGEVALSVADEGVLQVSGFRTPDPFETMYAPWDLAVTTVANWTNLLRPSDPRAAAEEEGGDAGALSSVRKRFVSSAFWAPALQTGADGKATVHFVAPDNLSAFRVMAMAADAGARFGAGERRFTVQKPLQVQPVLPRFLVPGDRAELAVLIHNHTGIAGRAKLQVKATGLDLEPPPPDVLVPAQGSIRVAFFAKALAGQSATLRADVGLGEARDALKIDLPLVERLIIERSLAGRGRSAGRTQLAVAWPDSGLVAAESRLEIAVDRTGLAALQPALAALVAYPYGCLEQTLSSFVPLAKVRELAVLAGLDGLQGPAIEKYLAAGALKLRRFQDGSGHFSLWPGGRGEPHYTVYALQGVVEAQKAGVVVDGAMVRSGLEALADWAGRQLQPKPGAEAVTLAIAAEVLAELRVPDAALNTRLWEARSGLSNFGRAHLLRALLAARAQPAQRRALLDELLSAVVETNDTAWLQDAEAANDDWWWPTANRVRPTAALLQALLIAQPKHPLLPKLAQHLVAAARQDGAWTNTHDNALAVTALAAWGKSQASGKARVTLALGATPLASETLTGHSALALRLPLAGLQPGVLTLQSDTPVRYSVRVVAARRDEVPSARDHGFAVVRRYLDAETGAEVTAIPAGKLVRVEVAIATPAPRRDVALVDPLPAGLEAVNLRLAGGGDADPQGPRQWHEQRDAEVRVFADRLPAGTTTYRYLTRALIAGRFAAAPATVQAMYEPDVEGRSRPAQFEVR